MILIAYYRYCLLNYAVKSSDYLDLALSEYWNRNDMKRSGRCLIFITNQALTEKNWVKPQNFSVRLPYIRNEILLLRPEHKAEAIPAPEWRLAVPMVKLYKSRMVGASPPLLMYNFTLLDA
jgi:hypothetical protein